MAVQDDVWQGFVSSLVSESYNHSGDALSAEDAAWVNSCLVKDPELSESGWNAMKDALLDILSSETPLGSNTSTAESDDFQRGTSTDVLMSEGGMAQNPGGTDTKMTQGPGGANTGMTEVPGGTNGNNVPLDRKGKTVIYFEETDENLTPITEKAEAEKFRGYLRNDMLKVHDLKQDESADVDMGLSLKNEIEFPLEDIFRVWDLNIPVEEEEELVKQLEKALAESSLETLPPLDDSVRDLDVGTVDNLIAGMGDLSLDQFSKSH